ncbi:Arylsulfatase [Pontiella desulfatans]|uniref:Arylsulfatase n=1 Tax=Pontiella desulfatans TaxID=2750659 RepID=A0A6C2UBY8_PONDE|nr:sulfatase-like hydrolase/transferase [Pontiella desulfatans]SPS74085.1 sulfatase S1_19 [Kiritimatiellales bacterium]VGO17459.1 Arylsulfatase [Pontiella desulfatans]
MKQLLSLLALIAALHAPHAAKQRPNIVLIMADDMGHADTGFTGSTDIRTPNLDRLAATGAVFEQGYVTHPFCGPSRAGIMSGRYQHRFGFETNPAYDPTNMQMGIAETERLVSTRLKTAGYTTGIIGKWHLGSAAPFHPNRRGFDFFYGFREGGHDYFRIDTIEAGEQHYLLPLERNNMPAVFEGYLTDTLTDEAVGFIERSKEQPFFLFLSYNAPHAPLQAPEEAIEKYAHIADPKRRVYAAMVDVMDQGIGRVVQTLEQQGVRENTLVFFLSDNGGPLAAPDKPHGGNGSSNGPWRGGKGDFYEGGLRVPMLANWPAAIQPGTSYPEPVISLDISRTIVELGGGETAAPEMEGVNLMPFLKQEKTGQPHKALFWRGYNHTLWSVLHNGKKYVKNKWDQPAELFDLNTDPAEQNNILNQSPESAATLKAMWDEWDEPNIPYQFWEFFQYNQKRKAFHKDAIPPEAKKARDAK